MVREDMEREVEKSIERQSPAREGKGKSRSGSKGWEALLLESLRQGSRFWAYNTGHSVHKQALRAKLFLKF